MTTTATPSPEAIEESKQAARAAGLRYVSDARPGIRRERDGDGFRYVAPDGHVIDDEATLARIRSLAIPPAYTDVWISPLPKGHLQATGRDAKGRKQSRYHPQWRAFRDETKYDRMMAFGAALPRIRARVEADLAKTGLSREKVLATIVRLLEVSLIRVGSEESVRANQHFGLTTMQAEHVAVSGATVKFHFVGKSGQEHDIALRDKKLARIVARLRDLPGEELFEYPDGDGALHKVHSEDVNDYIREASGGDFTAKDFRTWAGTVLAALALQELEAFDTQTQAKKNVVRAIENVAARLGNTPAVCRKCYVHPEILNSYLEGSLVESLKPQAEQELAEHLRELPAEEAAVMVFLQQRLARGK